ncbi:MAG: metallophosphoesterase family protein [Persicimonas sp.]
MLRIAVISDIHANPYALEAVVEDLDDQQVDEVLVGGDLVGRGPLGSAVVDLVRELGWPSVRGNHEDYTLEFRRQKVPDAWLVNPQWAASRWMAAELDEEHLVFLDDFPFTMTARSAPSLRLVHGSPRSHQEGIGEWTSEETLREHFESVDEPLLVCAHTHRPMVREVGDGLIVNVGSVGLPFNGDPRAQYAIFTKKPSGWEVEFRKVDYNRAPFLDDYETTGFLEEGGISALLLKREVETARPFLVPFLKWAEFTGNPPTFESLDAFDAIYSEEMSMGEFYRLLTGANE